MTFVPGMINNRCLFLVYFPGNLRRQGQAGQWFIVRLLLCCWLKARQRLRFTATVNSFGGKKERVPTTAEPSISKFHFFH